MKNIILIYINSFLKFYTILSRSSAQCWNTLELFNPDFIIWYVPHAIAEEKDWIAILIRRPEKNPITPSSLKIETVVSKILWYLISEFEVTKSIWAGCEIKFEFLFGRGLNFWVFLAILSHTDLLAQDPLKQVWVLSLVLITSKGVVGMEASPPAIPPQR